MVGLPGPERSLTISSAIWIQYVTDRQTDTGRQQTALTRGKIKQLSANKTNMIRRFLSAPLLHAWLNASHQTVLPWLLPRDAIRKRGLCCRPVSVRHVDVGYCIQTAEDIVKLLSQSDSSVILVFFTPLPEPISKRNPFSGYAKYKGRKILRSSTEIAIYLGNGKILLWNVNRKS